MNTQTTGFRYALMLYDKLVELSKLVPANTLLEYGYPPDDSENVRLFIGYSYKTSTSIGLSKSSHGTAMRILNAMQCVTQLKTGGPVTESVYLLNYRPTVEQHREFHQQSSATSRRISPSRYDTFIDELERIKTRLRTVENRLKELEGSNVRHNVRGS